jgi:hypothetical protein
MLSPETLPLLHSTEYYVNQYGDVLDRHQIALPVTTINGQKHVTIDWLFGCKPYAVAFLVLITYEKVKLPWNLLEEIEPLFEDNDSSNTTPANLVYRFRNGPLGIAEFPDFCYIPYFTRYGLSKNGELLELAPNSASSSRIIPWYLRKPPPGSKSKGNYLQRTIQGDKEYPAWRQLHRLLAMVYLRYGNWLRKYHVNHKDGEPSNNALNNLEWCTPLENIEHAIKHGLRQECQVILVKNLRTGEVIRYPSAEKAALALGGASRGDGVRRRIKNNHLLYPDFKVIKFDDETPWPEIDVNTAVMCRTYYSVPSEIIARNVFTGELCIFENAQEASRLLGVSPAMVNLHVSKLRVIPTKGFNFRYFDANEQITWPIHSEWNLRMYRECNERAIIGIVARDESGTDEFYISAAQASQALGVSETVIWNVIRSGKPIQGKVLRKHCVIDGVRDVP